MRARERSRGFFRGVLLPLLPFPTHAHIRALSRFRSLTTCRGLTCCFSTLRSAGQDHAPTSECSAASLAKCGMFLWAASSACRTRDKSGRSPIDETRRWWVDGPGKF